MAARGFGRLGLSSTPRRRPEADTITLDVGKIFTLTAANNGADGATGLPVIAPNENLTIIGNGDTIERSTASGTPAFRLFDVPGGTLTLVNLTLQGGHAEGYGFGEWARGGAVYSQGTLKLDGVIVQNNTAQGSVGTYPSGSAGGGLYSSGTLTMDRVIVQNNTAQGSDGSIYGSGSDAVGGGLYASGTLTMDGCTIRNNAALGGRGHDSLYGPGSSYPATDGGGANGGGAIAVPVFLALLLFVVRPFVAERFIVSSNSMAPIVVGWHHIGICPNCGGIMFSTTANTPGELGGPDPDRGICTVCMQAGPIKDMSTELQEADRVVVNKLLTPGRWDIIASEGQISKARCRNWKNSSDASPSW
jgi:hypothetical protein